MLRVTAIRTGRANVLRVTALRTGRANVLRVTAVQTCSASQPLRSTLSPRCPHPLTAAALPWGQVGLADDFPMDPQPGTIKYVYHTDIGPGASVLPSAESLADSDGMPLKQA